MHVAKLSEFRRAAGDVTPLFNGLLHAFANLDRVAFGHGWWLEWLREGSESEPSAWSDTNTN